MNKSIFLDDNKSRTEHFLSDLEFTVTCVETAQDTISLLAEPTNTLYLDHDLGGGSQMDSSRPDTGMEVVRWIVQNKPTIKAIIVHSMNFEAAAAMTKALYEARYDVRYIPFGVLCPGYKGV